MKINFLLILFMGFLAACGGSQDTAEVAEEQPAEAEAESRYSYTDSFEDGDPANLDIVNEWMSSLVNGNYDAAFDLLADSVYLILADGMEVNAPKDSIESMIMNMMSGIPSIEVNQLAAISSRSTEDGNNWVASYTWEKYGEENALYHEVYGIVNGKIRTVYQYRQVPSELDMLEEKEDGDYYYSGTWESLGDKNMAAFNEWVDLFRDQNVEAGADLWTDSVTVIFSDGNHFTGTRDSLIVRASEYASNAKDTDPVAVSSFKSIPQDTEWLFSWYTTTVDGQRVAMHEAWVVEDGKFAFVRQFSRPVPDSQD